MFELSQSETPEWMHLAHILEMSLSLLEGRDAEVVRMCTLHPFPSEKLLERIPSAVCVISGLGHGTNHFKGEKVKKKKSNVTFLCPWKIGVILFLLSSSAECWAGRLLLHLLGFTFAVTECHLIEEIKLIFFSCKINTNLA